MLYIATIVALLAGGTVNADNAPPKTAQYTIFCQRVTGLGHVEVANQLKIEVMKLSPLNDWYVLHNADDSVLYYGYYASVDDSKNKTEAARARADHKAIDALTDRAGNRLFPQSLFVPLDSPDPTAPPEWNLVNSKGFYTLQIGVYKDSPDRKLAAVEAVREARKQGIEAYYYHGEAISSVCIGSFPKESLRVIDPTKQEQAKGDESKDLVITSGLPSVVSSQLHAAEEKNGNVKFMEPSLQILDPVLLDMYLTKYTEHAINGVVETVTANGKQIPKHSIIVDVPHVDPGTLGATGEPPNLDMIKPNAPKTIEKKPKLKSLDDK